jgi:Na+/glutamate symporter
MKKQVHDPGGPVSPAARKKQKTVSSPEEKEDKKDRKGDALRRRRQERRLYDEMVVKAFLLGHIKDPYKEK